MLKNSFFFFFLFLSQILIAQDGHYLQHQQNYLPQAVSENDYDKAAQLEYLGEGVRSEGHSMRKMVYAFHPAWRGSSYRNYDFSLFPVIAYYGYIPDPATGSYETVYFWKTSHLIDEAHTSGCSVDLVVSLGGEKANRQLFSNPQAVQTLQDSLLALVAEREGDGVCLDFEQFPPDQKDAFTGFVIFLKEKLKQQNRKAQISLTLPEMDFENTYDFQALDRVVDLYILKVYHRGEALSPGPVAPMHKGSDWGVHGVDASISHYLKKGLKKEKMLLGVSYQGNKWKLKEGKIGREVIGEGEKVNYTDFKKKFRVDSVVWDKESMGNAYYDWKESSVVWMEDAASLEAKYEQVFNRNLAGAAIWGLGLDHGFDGLTSKLRTSFVQKTESNAPIAVDKDSYLLGSDNGATIERNRDSWMWMLGGCIFLILLLIVLKRVM